MSDTSKERIEKISDSDLQGEIDLNEIKRKSLEQSLKWLNDEDNAYKAELTRRELDRFWAANPTLLRLEVGDKLLVTEEGWAMFTHRLGYKQGDIGTIIGFKGEYAHIQWHDGDSLINLDIASELRKAYLAQEQGTKP